MITLKAAAEKALMALQFAEESGRSWPLAVRMARNAAIADLRAALSDQSQEDVEPVVIAGRYTAYPQRGTPNHCFNAQVFGPDGLSVATFDSTADPRHAYRYAMALADALNAPQPAAQQETAIEHCLWARNGHARCPQQERKPLTDGQILDFVRRATGIAGGRSLIGEQVTAFTRIIEAAHGIKGKA